MAEDSSLINDSLFGNVTAGAETTNFTSSDGEYDEMDHGYFYPAVDVPAMFLAVLIVIVNGWVLVLMAKKKYLRSITNLLLCSLAVSDLLTGLVAIPLFIACNIIRQSAICLTEEQLARFISASIVSHLMSAVSDRYLAIVHPLRYTSLVTRPRCILVILFIWLMSAITALVQFTWLDPVHHDPHEELSKGALKAELIYDIVFLFFFFLLPFALTCFTYGSIIFEIVRQSRNIQRQNLPSSHNARSRNPHERKAIAIFAAMLLVYIICWLPYFGLRRFDLSEVPISLIYVVIWLRYLASLLNPCMYIFGKYDYRKALREHLRPVKTEHNFTSIRSTVLRATLAVEMNETFRGETAAMHDLTKK